MLVPDRSKTNAYRVLRLPADATASEIYKAAATMNRASALGTANTNAADLPGLGEVPRTESDIRTALDRLKNPEQRLTERLFWFHFPVGARENQDGPLTQDATRPNPETACRHDNALRGLLAALKAGVSDAGVSVWIQALRAWDRVVSDDDYWSLTLALEERGAFEPPALASEVDSVRGNAVRTAAEGLIAAGRDALARNEAPTVRRILETLGELADTGEWVPLAQDEIAAPAIERFRVQCSDLRDEFGSKIVREQNAAKANKSFCVLALKRFRDEIEPALQSVIQLLPQDHEAAQQSREAAALCLSAIAIDFTWADDFITSEKLRDEALRLGEGTLAAIRIEDGLAQIREAARKQRIFGNLKSISSAPSLRTINGFGFRLYGSSDYDEETRSYVTTYYFVGLFLPIFPIARYRVVNMGERGYSFLGKLPLRQADRWILVLHWV